MNIKSTAIFDFLLKTFRNLSSLLRSLTYLSLLNSFLFLSRFSVSLKSLDNLKRWFAYKSLLSRFSVLISYNMWSSNHFSISSCFPCFLGSRFFKVRVHRVQGPGPGFRSSHCYGHPIQFIAHSMRVSLLITFTNRFVGTFCRAV